MNNKYSYTEEELREAVKTSTSIRQVLEKLNIVPAGGNYQTTNRRIEKLNIDTSHFMGQAWNKGLEIGPKRPIEEYLIENSVVQSFRLKNRLISEGLKEHKCECCGLTEWLGEPIPLELDHVDGDHYNNTLENLKILCPNCHAKTPTYRGKNKRNKKTNSKATKGKHPHFCSSCGVTLSGKSKTGLCKSCCSISQRKVERPLVEQLIKEVEESSYLAVGRKYGVSDNTIRKWLKQKIVEPIQQPS